MVIIAALATTILIVFGIQSQKNEYWTYPIMLMLMPLNYVAFAWLGDTTTIVTQELLMMLPFVLAGTICLIKGVRWSGYILAIGWLGHGLYDFFHESFFINQGTPSWFGIYCGLIDVLVAMYLVYYSTRLANQSWAKT